MVSTGIRYDGAMSDWGQKLTWAECPLLAQSGRSKARPLPAAERTCHTYGLKSLFDP